MLPEGTRWIVFGLLLTMTLSAYGEVRTRDRIERRTRPILVGVIL